MRDRHQDSSLWVVSILAWPVLGLQLVQKLSEGQLMKASEKTGEVTAVVSLLDREQSVHVILCFFCGLQ